MPGTAPAYSNAEVMHHIDPMQNETDGDAEDDEVGEDDVQASVWPPHLPMDGLIPSPGRTGSGHLESATQPHQRTRSAAVRQHLEGNC